MKLNLHVDAAHCERGVHSSLNNPLVLSSACSPCMGSVFAAGFMRKPGSI